MSNQLRGEFVLFLCEDCAQDIDEKYLAQAAPCDYCSGYECNNTAKHLVSFRLDGAGCTLLRGD